MYGKRVAVTAGHCVYSAKDGGWAEWVKIYPGRNGSSSPFGSYYATVLHTDVKYINSKDHNFDWGLLEFNTDIGETTGYFGAMWQANSMVGTRIIEDILVKKVLPCGLCQDVLKAIMRIS